MGIRKQDDNCCPGHAKYGQRGLTMLGVQRPRDSSKDKPRKAKVRQFLRHAKNLMNEEAIP